MWNPNTCDCGCNKACKIDKYLDTENCSHEKHLFGKLVLACEDEMLNKTETSLDDKKVTCEKNNCRIPTISLVTICLLLLAVISINCYYYHAKDCLKKNVYCCINIK